MKLVAYCLSSPKSTLLRYFDNNQFECIYFSFAKEQQILRSGFEQRGAANSASGTVEQCRTMILE
jgi:hypothetical protein